MADAVLYEGYVLYPYRASARKNQLRWQFGVLAPPAYAAAEGSERSAMRTEVVVDPGGDARRHRAHPLPAGAAPRRRGGRGPTATFAPAEVVAVDGVQWVAWDEAVEHEIDLGRVPLLPLAEQPDRARPSCSTRATAPSRSRTRPAEVVGRAVRRRERVDGVVRGRDGVGRRPRGRWSR